MRHPLWWLVIAGALVGSLVTLLVVALFGPRGSSGEASTPSSFDALSPHQEESLSPVPGDRGSGDDDKDGKPSEAPLVAGVAAAGKGRLPDARPVRCGAPNKKVSDAGELEQALKDAAPGDTIGLADGTYEGTFTATVSGTRGQPISLCGSKAAVLSAGDVENGYVLHLDHARYWHLVGFSVTDGQKGVMADATVGSVLQDLTVTRTGDEAIHLRNNSTDNVVARNTVSDTGNRKDKFGEGIYIGTAVSNWCSYTDCKADRSDRNVVTGNTITDVTAEAVDIKEGTTGGVLANNSFDGSKMSGADSWVDVKGNNWLIEANNGTHSTEDGFQTHEILDGWGDHNLFTNNLARVDGPGLGFALRPERSNVVTCSNQVQGAGEGLSNIDCR